MEVLERGLGVGGDLLDQVADRLVLVSHDLLREGELDPQGDQALLRAVVQVALDAPALRVGGVRDPGA